METSASPPNLVICPGCAKPNFEGAHFCTECGAPLTSYATTAPFESTLSRGYAIRRAVAERPRGIVLIGIWLCMLPLALVSIGGLFVGLESLWFGLVYGYAVSIVSGLAITPAVAVIVWISTGTIFRVTREYVIAARRPASMATSQTGQLPDQPHADDETMICLACGAQIAEGQEACESCGWSYEDEPVEPTQDA